MWKCEVHVCVTFCDTMHVPSHSSVCQEYFQDGGMKKALDKDARSAQHALGLTAPSLALQDSAPCRYLQKKNPIDFMIIFIIINFLLIKVQVVNLLWHERNE